MPVLFFSFTFSFTNSIWMGDGGKLFVRDDKTVTYFGLSGARVYKVDATTP